MNRIAAAIILASITALLNATASEVVAIPATTISFIVPEGAKLIPKQGEDTLIGDIELGTSRETIHYDIGYLAGNYATAKSHGKILWQRSDKIAGFHVDYSLADLGNKYSLRVCFPKAGSANFYAYIDDPKDVEPLMKIIRTFSTTRK